MGEIPVHEITNDPESVRHPVPDNAGPIRWMVSLRDRHIEGGSVQVERRPEQQRRGPRLIAASGRIGSR